MFLVWLKNEYKISLRNINIIWLLSLKDIRARYAATYLGPIWNSMNFIVFILLIGAVYAKLWGTRLDEFIPYFAVSFLCWTFISNCFLEASSQYLPATFHSFTSDWP